MHSRCSAGKQGRWGDWEVSGGDAWSWWGSPGNQEVLLPAPGKSPLPPTLEQLRGPARWRTGLRTGTPQGRKGSREAPGVLCLCTPPAQERQVADVGLPEGHHCLQFSVLGMTIATRVKQNCFLKAVRSSKRPLGPSSLGEYLLT